MSQRIASTYTREEFPAAVKRAAWERCGGRCEGCGTSLLGVSYVYDHDWPTRLGGPPTLENCKVLCDDGPGSCNDRKTHGLDLPGIAAAKRYAKNRLPLDIERPAKKPGTIKNSRGFPKGHRPIPGRPFPKRQK